MSETRRKEQLEEIARVYVMTLDEISFLEKQAREKNDKKALEQLAQRRDNIEIKKDKLTGYRTKELKVRLRNDKPEFFPSKDAEKKAFQRAFSPKWYRAQLLEIIDAFMERIGAKDKFEQYEEYKLFINHKRTQRLDISKRNAAVKRIKNLWIGLNKKHPRHWTPKEIYDFLEEKQKKGKKIFEIDPMTGKKKFTGKYEPLKIGTMQSYLSIIRMFIKRSGLFKYIGEIDWDYFGGKEATRGKEEDKRYLKPKQLAKMFHLIPKIAIDKPQELIYNAAIHFMISTACRRGHQITPAEIRDWKEQGWTTSRMEHRDRGLRGTKLDRINWNDKPEATVVIWEKWREDWKARLTDICIKALKVYLMDRFELSEKEFEKQKMNLHKLETEDANKSINGMVYLFPINNKFITELFTNLWVQANKDGTPFLDEHGRELELGKVAEDEGAGFSPHILRKSYVRNLMNKGISPDVISDSCVGWKDLSTMLKFYGKIPEEQVILARESFSEIEDRILGKPEEIPEEEKTLLEENKELKERLAKLEAKINA